MPPSASSLNLREGLHLQRVLQALEDLEKRIERERRAQRDRFFVNIPSSSFMSLFIRPDQSTLFFSSCGDVMRFHFTPLLLCFFRPEIGPLSEYAGPKITMYVRNNIQ